MKVLHLISSGGMYGAEAVLLNLAHAMAHTSDESILGVFADARHGNTDLHRIATAQGIRSVLIPCSGQIDRHLPAALREVAASLGVDLIHAHGYKTDVYTFFAFRGRAIPFLATCHTWYDTDRTARLYGAIDRFVLRSFSAVVAVSADVERRLLQAGVARKRVHRIDNGIDLQPFQNVAPSLRESLNLTAAPIVGLVGRLAHEKGIDLFIAAAQRVLQAAPATQFVIIGDGPQRAQFTAALTQQNLDRSIHLAGRREDMPAVYASLDIMVSASRLEGLPMAMLEGMASGCAVVATAVGEVPSLILNGETGLLVPPNNVDALTTAILSLLHSPEQRHRLGTAARAFVQRSFSAQHMAASYLALYHSLLGSTPASPQPEGH